MYINGYFVLLFDLSADHNASDEHTSLSENDNIIIELKFDKALIDPFTCLPYLEYDSSIRIYYETSQSIF